jgi:hypothetical protein
VIPKLLHRVWPGDDEIPTTYEDYWATWQRYHPGWEAVTWRPADYLPLVNQRWYDMASGPAQRADIARYEILHRHGGIYVDTDFECLRPFDALIEGLDGFAGLEDETILCISLIGVTPKHPFVDQLMAMVPYSITANPDATPAHQTGPVLATRVLHEGSSIFTPPLFKVFPSSYFYPYRWDEKYREGESFPDAYAVHHWSGSWVEGGIPQRAPDRLRVVVEFDWARAAAPSAVVARFGELFEPGDPVELAVPLGGADRQTVLQRLAEIIVASAANPNVVAGIALYADDQARQLDCAGRAACGSDRADQEQRVIALLEAHRRRLDAYREHVGRQQAA